jgi:hypothetical protein
MVSFLVLDCLWKTKNPAEMTGVFCRMNDAVGLFRPLRIWRGRLLGDDASCVALFHVFQTLGNQTARKSCHGDAAGFGSVVKRRDQ